MDSHIFLLFVWEIKIETQVFQELILLRANFVA